MKATIGILTVLALMLGAAAPAGAHCEIPCGIYGDPLRFQLLAEHISTVEKSMKQIVELSAKKNKTAQDHNQLARWVANKENHATEIQDIVSQYFLHQRIKPAPKGEKGRKKYIAELTSAHALLIGAMKAKQTVDLGVVAKLRSDLKALEKAYGHSHK